jgi:tRNA-Thr(GGU) m(6)t(6)A37 methyltransferase TsaA
MSFTPASPRYDTSTIRLLPWDDATSRSAGGALADGPYELQPIGWVESPLVDPATAPKQGDEGSPEAWLEFGEDVREGLRDLQCGADVIVLTWLDRARRDVLSVHPRDDPANPEQGVFSTRSPHRPNPIGLHRVNIVSIEGTRILVRNLEAVNRTPIVDMKPVLNRQLDG